MCAFIRPKGGAALLYGVTGSGKTPVYIRLINEAILLGKTSVVLVPEIALTPQLMRTFTSYFGSDVAVLHSALSMGERYDEWKRIRSGSVKVVIGTRSAVFAPVDNLGLIILDEEQENTYKSENTPRYHARDIAKYRCAHAGALLLLGSATPDIESMYNARNGKYRLLRLTHRFNESPLPPVIIADMKKELLHGRGGMISEPLEEELRKNIAAGSRVSFLSTGAAPAPCHLCRVRLYPHLSRCSVSLTYHSANRRLMCHYCGYSEPYTESCPACGGPLKYIGAGTQKIEQELGELFPGTGVIRMDTDTVSPARSHDAMLSQFSQKKVPILLGTQMVTKGLDFENVTLVGVLSADQMLYVNDYRAHERAFSLITQVVGRSGRGQKSGRAVIQTFTPIMR
jgi:primosomal protein N' (replication factor Y)